MTEQRSGQERAALAEGGDGGRRIGPEALARGAEWLRQGGLRPTRQRLALAALLIGDGQHRHVSAETLFRAAKEAGEEVSLATVYNTLGAFCEAGLITEVTINGQKSWFDTRVDDHPHFYFEESDELVDAPKEQLRFASLPDLPPGHEIDKIDVVIKLRRRLA